MKGEYRRGWGGKGGGGGYRRDRDDWRPQAGGKGRFREGKGDKGEKGGAGRFGPGERDGMGIEAQPDQQQWGGVARGYQGEPGNFTPTMGPQASAGPHPGMQLTQMGFAHPGMPGQFVVSSPMGDMTALQVGSPTGLPPTGTEGDGDRAAEGGLQPGSLEHQQQLHQQQLLQHQHQQQMMHQMMMQQQMQMQGFGVMPMQMQGFQVMPGQRPPGPFPGEQPAMPAPVSPTVETEESAIGPVTQDAASAPAQFSPPATPASAGPSPAPQIAPPSPAGDAPPTPSTAARKKFEIRNPTTGRSIFDGGAQSAGSLVATQLVPAPADDAPPPPDGPAPLASGSPEAVRAEEEAAAAATGPAALPGGEAGVGVVPGMPPMNPMMMPMGMQNMGMPNMMVGGMGLPGGMVGNQMGMHMGMHGMGMPGVGMHGMQGMQGMHGMHPMGMHGMGMPNMMMQQPMVVQTENGPMLAYVVPSPMAAGPGPGMPTDGAEGMPLGAAPGVPVAEGPQLSPTEASADQLSAGPPDAMHQAARPPLEKPARARARQEAERQEAERQRIAAESALAQPKVKPPLQKPGRRREEEAGGSPLNPDAEVSSWEHLDTPPFSTPPNPQEASQDAPLRGRKLLKHMIGTAGDSLNLDPFMNSEAVQAAPRLPPPARQEQAQQTYVYVAQPRPSVSEDDPAVVYSVNDLVLMQPVIADRFPKPDVLKTIKIGYPSAPAPTFIPSPTRGDWYERGSEPKGKGKGRKGGKSWMIQALVPSATAYVPAYVSQRRGEYMDTEAELRRKVNAVLNKVTWETFDELCNDLCRVRLVSGQQLDLVVNLVFDKAITQHHYCEMYADMCLKLKATYPEFADNTTPGVLLSFQRCLVNRCQDEFENLPVSMDLEDTEKQDVKHDSREMELLVKKRKDRVLGNMKFIGQLYLRRLLGHRVVREVVLKLIFKNKRPEEHYIECLCTLMRNIGKTLDSTEVGKQYITTFLDRMRELAGLNYGTRIKFAIEGILTLHERGWVETSFKEKAKTRSEIQADYKREEAAKSRGERNPFAQSAIAGARPSHIEDQILDEQRSRAEHRKIAAARAKREQEKREAEEHLRQAAEANSVVELSQVLPGLPPRKRTLTDDVFAESVKKMVSYFRDEPSVEELKKEWQATCPNPQLQKHALQILLNVGFENLRLSSTAAKICGELVSCGLASMQDLQEVVNRMVQNFEDIVVDHPKLPSFLQELTSRVLMTGAEFESLAAFVAMVLPFKENEANYSFLVDMLLKVRLIVGELGVQLKRALDVVQPVLFKLRGVTPTQQDMRELHDELVRIGVLKTDGDFLHGVMKDLEANFNEGNFTEQSLHDVLERDTKGGSEQLEKSTEYILRLGSVLIPSLHRRPGSWGDRLKEARDIVSHLFSTFGRTDQNAGNQQSRQSLAVTSIAAACYSCQMAQDDVRELLNGLLDIGMLHLWALSTWQKTEDDNKQKQHIAGAVEQLLKAEDYALDEVVEEVEGEADEEGDVQSG